MQPLRDYQQRAVDAVRALWAAGKRRVLLVAPTGAGKSVMGLALVAPFQRALWLAHRRELVADAARRLREELGACDVGLIAAGHPPSPYAPFQVSSVQTLVRRIDAMPGADAVAFDECHHAKSDEWEKLLIAYPEANHLLLTATPERQDGKPMADVADAIVVAADYSELLQAGHLCEVRVFRPDQILGNGLAMNPAEAWKRYSEGSPGFAFFGTVDQAYQYEHEMNALGIRAAVIEQGTEPVKRSGYIEAMRAGELDCICNVQTMTEGVDIPRARVCMLASACRHCGGYLQKAGRVLRPHASKPNAILIDLVGASILHGLPTENRTYSLDGDPIRRTDVIPTRQCQKCAAIVHASYKACPECSFPFGILGPKGKTEVKIHSLELIEVYAGKDTPVDAKRAEYRRLREIQRINKYPLYWIQSEYRKLFAEDVIISDATNSEKRIEHEKLIAIQRRSGAKPGMVFIRFKNLFGHAPPSHKRVGM